MENERNHSPPPSYSETIGIPPPAYSETPEHHLGPQQNDRDYGNRVVPSAPATWSSSTNQNTLVVITQPQPARDISSRGSETAITQSETDHRKRKGCSCNAYCVSCKNRPCSLDGECFCYNCLTFMIYALTCGPGTLFCMCCKTVCPDTYGDCPPRHTSLNESYLFRSENVLKSCCWFMCGPICCMSCDESTEVCPLATPCKEHCGMSCVRRMTCYCGGNSLSDCRCNAMDQHACGFLWDCKQIGCKLY